MLGKKFFTKYQFKGPIGNPSRDKFNCKIYNKVCVMDTPAFNLLLLAVPGLIVSLGIALRIQRASSRSNEGEGYSY